MKTSTFSTMAIGCLVSLAAASALAEGPANPKYAPAQTIVDRLIKEHPEVLVIAMHVTPPGEKDNVIVASRFRVPPGKWEIQRIGKVADEDDRRVIKTGKPNLEVNKTGDRFEVEAAMLDGAGKIIGAVGIVFPYKPRDDKKALEKKGEQVRDQIRKQTPTLASLFAKSK